MSPQSGVGFLYLDQNGFLLYTSTTPAVVQFAFPQDIIRDLEIINRDLLQAELTKFFKVNSLQPARYIFALSPNLLFEKPFSDSKSSQTEKEIEQFLDNMPFEHTATIIFENAESKLIATNKDLYQTIVKIFGQFGCVVEYILPSYVLGIDVNQALVMNPQMLSDMYHRAASLRQYSFLTDTAQPVLKKPEQAKQVPDKSVVAKPEAEKAHKRLLILVGTFVLLLLVLGVVVFLSFRQ